MVGECFVGAKECEAKINALQVQLDAASKRADSQSADISKLEEIYDKLAAISISVHQIAIKVAVLDKKPTEPSKEIIRSGFSPIATTVIGILTTLLGAFIGAVL